MFKNGKKKIKLLFHFSTAYRSTVRARRTQNGHGSTTRRVFLAERIRARNGPVAYRMPSVIIIVVVTVSFGRRDANKTVSERSGTRPACYSRETAEDRGGNTKRFSRPFARPSGKMPFSTIRRPVRAMTRTRLIYSRAQMTMHTNAHSISWTILFFPPSVFSLNEF